MTNNGTENPNKEIININNQTINKVIKSYIKIYDIFFKYLFLGLSILLSIIISYNIISQKQVIQTENQSEGQNEQSILASIQLFEKQQSTKIKDGNYEIKIIGGEIKQEENNIKSYNNLISYLGIILPSTANITIGSKIEGLNYFQKNDYDIKEIENFVKNIVFNTSNESNININIKKTNNLANIKNTIIETFSLNCLDYNKIYSQICNHYTKNYINNFFYYDLSKDYIGFKILLEKLQNKKNEICTNTIKYVLYSRDTNINKNIFEKCGTKLVDEIQNTKSFIQINKEIDNKYINDNVYQNKDLNEYKLLSYQQIIFEDFKNSKIPTERISKYLEFLKKALKINGLENFYIDETYRYNNYFLLDQINKFYDYSNEESKRKIHGIIQDINALNYTNKFENTNGLEEMLTNKQLIKLQETQKEENIDFTGKIEILAKEIEETEYLIINTKKIIGSKIEIDGYIKIEVNNTKNLIDTNMELDYNGQYFVISKIKINNLENIDKLVNKFTAINTKTLAETYEYLKQTFGFYNTSNQQTGRSNNICKKLKEELTGLDLRISVCEDKEIAINHKQLLYKISYNNFIITKISISDSQINKELNETFGWIKTNENNIIKTIINIVTYKDETNFKTKYIDIATVEKIEKDIGPILEFAQSGNKLVFETNIKGIDLIINYNKTKREIGPIYLKNILINDRPMIIKNTYIKIDDTKETKKLKSNPINYIMEKDKSAYFLYQKATN